MRHLGNHILFLPPRGISRPLPDSIHTDLLSAPPSFLWRQDADDNVDASFRYKYHSDLNSDYYYDMGDAHIVWYMNPSSKQTGSAAQAQVNKRKTTGRCRLLFRSVPHLSSPVGHDRAKRGSEEKSE